LLTGCPHGHRQVFSIKQLQSPIMEVILPGQDAYLPLGDSVDAEDASPQGAAVSVPTGQGSGAADYASSAREEEVTIDHNIIFKFMNSATAIEIMFVMMLYIFGDLKVGVRAKPGKEPQGDALQRGQACTFPDVAGYGSGFIEYAFGPVPEGVQVPTLFEWRPAYSFAFQPSTKMETDYRIGAILKGVMINRKTAEWEFWQTPDPVNKLTETIQIQNSDNGGLIHIRDIGSATPDGRSYMKSIIADFYDLALARRKLMQAGNRAAGAFFTVKLDLNEIAGKEDLLAPSNGAKKSSLKDYYEKIITHSKNIVKKVSTSTSTILYPGEKLESPNVQMALDPMAFHKYIKTGILQHFIPRHIVETEGNSLTSTGSSIIDILQQIAEGWRRVYNYYIMMIGNLILEKNGLLDLECYPIWPAIKEEDKDLVFQRAVTAITEMLIPPSRFMTLVGWDQLTDIEKTELEEYWTQRQAKGVA
jgi:hypothetical protein